VLLNVKAEGIYSYHCAFCGSYRQYELELSNNSGGQHSFKLPSLLLRLPKNQPSLQNNAYLLNDLYFVRSGFTLNDLSKITFRSLTSANIIFGRNLLTQSNSGISTQNQHFTTWTVLSANTGLLMNLTLRTRLTLSWLV
jgi:hypothetical protein